MPLTPSYRTLGSDRLLIICLAAKLYKYISNNGEGYSVAKGILRGSYGRAFDACVDIYIKPARSVWRQIPARERERLLDTREYSDALRLEELAPYPGAARFFDNFKREVRLHMPELRFMESSHRRRCMMSRRNHGMLEEAANTSVDFEAHFRSDVERMVLESVYETVEQHSTEQTARVDSAPSTLWQSL